MRTMKVRALATVAVGAAAVGLTRRMNRRPAETAGVALVTGSSRGLGYLIARELAERGFRLAICARDPDELAEAAADLSGRGAGAIAEACDVADREQVDRL